MPTDNQFSTASSTLFTWQSPTPLPNPQTIVASNRNSTNAARDVMLSDANDKIVNMLENTPPYTRGGRTRPTILKYPTDIGTGEYPHVMQFKVFWRWEAKELKDLKAEQEKKVQVLKTYNEMIDRGAYNSKGASRCPLPAIAELQNDPSLMKLIDPNAEGTLLDAIRKDPSKQKQLVEQAITAYENRVGVLDNQIKGNHDNNGSVGNKPDDLEREQINSRLNTVLGETSALGASLKTGTAVFAADTIRRIALGEDVGDAFVKAGVAGLGSGAGVGLVIKAAQAFANNQPKYDQMVSIYLPVCTKIANEDTFVYEDASGAMIAGMLDAFNNTMQTVPQAAAAGSVWAANKIGLGGAFGAISGLVLNPRLEKVFKAKDFRTFQFSWEMYPRTSEESRQIRDIIETFRYHASPAYATDADDQVGEQATSAKLILRAPAEFTVRFLSTNPDPSVGGYVENPYIPKIARCACNSIQVDYSPNSVFSTFNDNAPSSVTFTLSFQEIETLTREGIDQGF